MQSPLTEFLCVAEVSIRYRILKDIILELIFDDCSGRGLDPLQDSESQLQRVLSEVQALRGRGLDPLQDSESSSRPRQRLKNSKVAEVSIRYRILKDYL